MKYQILITWDTEDPSHLKIEDEPHIDEETRMRALAMLYQDWARVHYWHMDEHSSHTASR